MKFRHILPFLLLIPLLTGCPSLRPADILPGNDPVVVNTERSSQAAFAAYKAAVEYDHDNLAFMKDKLPQIHEQVQMLRREFPPLYTAVRDATKTFKQTRLPTDAAVMNQKLGELNKMQIIAQQALATATQRRTAVSGDQQPNPGVRAID